MHTAFRRRLAAALLAALALLTGRAALAQGPALTIVLSGNTYGNYEPCPS